MIVQPVGHSPSGTIHDAIFYFSRVILNVPPPFSLGVANLVSLRWPTEEKEIVHKSGLLLSVNRIKWQQTVIKK